MARNIVRMVTKRSGNTVPYDTKKICAAITGANKDAGNKMSKSDIMAVVLQVDIDLRKYKTMNVEQIQDTVEDRLMVSGFTDVARAYVKYRQIHEIRRNAAQKLMESYDDLLFADPKDMDLKRDNANINTDAPMGIMLKLGTEGAKSYVDNYILTPEVAEADRQGYIHVHDKDFSLITFNCCQIDLGKLFKGGFSTGHGFLREPNSIRAAASLACIAIQSNQNDMFGGQSINALDFALAPYVDRSFVKATNRAVEEWFKFFNYEQLPMDFSMMKYGMPIEEARHYILNVLNQNGIIADTKDADRIYDIASESVEEETKQAMEAMIHNFNTLHSRAGKMCA